MKNQKTPIDKERYYETIEMPDYLAKMTDEELYQTILTYHNQFVGAITSQCIKFSIPDYKKQQLIEVEAVRQGLVLYEGLWVQPLVILPNRFKKVIKDNQIPIEIVT